MSTDLKYLKQLFKLCRENGIEAIELEDGTKFTMVLNYSPKPSNKAYNQRQDDKESFDPGKIPTPQIGAQSDQIPGDALTEEQLLYYSSVPQGAN